MQNILFPVNFKFKISTFANDFIASDANDDTIAYVRQKMFKFKEDIQIYSDESRSQENYRIRADRWLDFSAAYAFFDANGNEFGKVVRKGWRSLWKANYEIINEHQEHQFSISEENGWVKVMDALFAEIPILGIFTGYLFNPSYMVTDLSGEPIVRLTKKPSFFGRKFELVKIGMLKTEDSEKIMLGLMMMILLERRRG
ncbi:hypothetical protein [Chondrinema litorale]|uniref:hypothetical protein n=1 Tax=Chondrinema litorale TaxID=2994555 RepID=UPI002543BDBA|nr:hypothetical protein [Chondrinema litorale]UZR98582.1 hypothetical protein OQ292_32660 [Chondrinema litorale]